MILEIHIEQVGCEGLERFFAVVLTAKIEIGRFIDETEVLAGDPFQYVE